MLLAYLLIACVGSSALGFIAGRRTAAAALRRARTAERHLHHAERALRTIANGSAGAPELEAQIALDELNSRNL